MKTKLLVLCETDEIKDVLKHLFDINIFVTENQKLISILNKNIFVYLITDKKFIKCIQDGSMKLTKVDNEYTDIEFNFENTTNFIIHSNDIDSAIDLSIYSKNRIKIVVEEIYDMLKDHDFCINEVGFRHSYNVETNIVDNED